MDESILTFTEVLASTAPTPGGGGAAALMGALAASLGAMASRLSAGRKSAAERSARLNEAAERCEELRLRFLEQIAADEAAFLPLAAAYKLPKDEPERAETLSAFLSLASGIERGLYPTSAKYHMNRLGVRMTLHCRNQKEEAFTPLLRREIDDLLLLEQKFLAEYT